MLINKHEGRQTLCKDGRKQPYKQRKPHISTRSGVKYLHSRTCASVRFSLEPVTVKTKRFFELVQKYVTLYCSTKHKQGYYRDESIMRISEAFEAYRTGFVVYAQSHKTEEQLLCSRNSLIKYLGDKQMEDVTIDNIRAWLYHLHQRGLSPTTIKGYGEKLKLVLKYHNKFLDPKLIVLPKRINKTPDWLKREEVEEIIECLSVKRKGVSLEDRLRILAVISTLYSTGLRVSELCRVDIKDIDNDTISTIGKNSKPRLVFLDKRSIYLINEYLKVRNDNTTALFTGRTGKRLNPMRIRDMFRKASKTTGIDFHPHTLRHSFATNLLDNKCHIYTLQRLMGHSNIATTSIYLHIKDPELQEAHKKYHTF